MHTLFIDRMPTEIGEIVLINDGAALVYLDFAENSTRQQRLLTRRYGTVQLINSSDPHGFRTPLARYFAGELDAVAELPVSTGGTAFQQRVWLALRDIPAGQTISYGALASRLGLPNGARAVGITNSLNPISIVLPCHRVIGANHALTGYAGGIERKRWLLRHEGVFINEPGKGAATQNNVSPVH